MYTCPKRVSSYIRALTNVKNLQSTSVHLCKLEHKIVSLIIDVPYLKGEWYLILCLEWVYALEECIGENKFFDERRSKVVIFKIKMYGYS